LIFGIGLPNAFYRGIILARSIGLWKPPNFGGDDRCFPLARRQSMHQISTTLLPQRKGGISEASLPAGFYIWARGNSTATAAAERSLNLYFSQYTNIHNAH
jgi:hypothetical protein